MAGKVGGARTAPNRRRRALPTAEKTSAATAILGLPARVAWQEGRGRHGGACGHLGQVRGGAKRRGTAAAGARVCSGAGREGERREGAREERIGSRKRASAGSLSSPREQRRRASPRRDRRPEPRQAAAWLPVGRRQRIFMYNPLHLAIFPELRK
jgi:hypothetical protein